MSLERKTPLHFDLRYGSPRRQLALLPFSGLNIGENPLTADKGSCSDILNMVVDNDHFLTLRPRLIDDPEYLKAKATFNASLDGEYAEYQGITDTRYIKDGYLFLTTRATVIPTKYVLTITNSIVLALPIGMNAWQGELIINGDTINLIFGPGTLTKEQIAQNIYNLAYAQRNNLETFPYYEEGSNVVEFVLFDQTEYNPVCFLGELTLDEMHTLPVSIPNTIVEEPITTNPLGELALVFYKDGALHWLLEDEFKDVKELTSFDDYLIYPEKDYYRFIRKLDGKNFILQNKDRVWEFKELEPYIPTYKHTIMSTVNLDKVPIYEDLNILTNKYRLKVEYILEDPIDLKHFEKTAIESEGDVLKKTDHDFNSDRVILFQNEDGYLFYLASDYLEATTTNDDLFLLHFFYYSFDLKDIQVLFTIRVHKNTVTGGGILRDDLEKLYSSTPRKDGNGKVIPPLYYDVGSHGLFRHKQVFRRKIGYDLYHYSIDDEEFYTKSFLPKTGQRIGVSLETFFYVDGEIAISFVASDIEQTFVGRALLIYNAHGDVFYTLFGSIIKNPAGTDDFEYQLYCAIDVDGENTRLLKPLFYFEANGKKRLISNGSLASYVNQHLEDDSDILMTPIDAELHKDDGLQFYLYYDLDSGLVSENYYDLSKKLPNILDTTTYTIGTMGRYIVLYSLSLSRLFLIDLEYPDGSFTFTISTLTAVGEIKNIHSFIPSPWGTVYGYITVTKDEEDYPAILVINREETKIKGIIQYNYHIIKDVELPGNNHHITPEGIIIINDTQTEMYRVSIHSTTFEFIYDLTNENNPLEIKDETIEEFQKRQLAFQFMGVVGGRTLVRDSLVYFNDSYVFATEPKNFDYIPAIHCQKALNPIRFASSYLQELGVIYQRNNITYMGWVENPFKEETFLAHDEVLQYDHLEQRAIDYLPNGHLVTFAGLTIYLNKTGVYALNFEPETPQDTERRATLLSSTVNSKLLKEDLDTAILANFEPYVMILFPKGEFTSIYALKLMTGQWYYWEIPLVVQEILDDNHALRLISDNRYIRLTEDVELIDVTDENRVVIGSVEKYLDFGTDVIRWYWKSQPIHLGSVTARKQITQTHFVFLNPNASFNFDRDTFDLTHSRITNQRFGIRFYAFQEHVTERPTVDYEAELQIINNIRRRTYINRFKYCQLLCYNIDDENATTDKVRLGNIVFTYKVLSGGK